MNSSTILILGSILTTWSLTEIVVKQNDFPQCYSFSGFVGRDGYNLQYLYFKHCLVFWPKSRALKNVVADGSEAVMARIRTNDSDSISLLTYVIDNLASSKVPA